MQRLEGKVILVAGAGGIGGELARRYAAEGASVVLGDINLDDARAVVGEIERAGGRGVAIHLDGAEEASVAAAVAQCVDSFGGLDGMHANFATFIDNADDTGIVELPLAVFDETIRVNLRGFVLCARSALPAMVERGGGAILFTSSIGAYMGGPNRVAYAISKEAGHALMRHIAVRYGAQGIRANCVAPGTILHDKVASEISDEFKAQLLSAARIKSRLGRPEDIAGLSALLMSDEGSYITGQIITVDGGATMRP